jgi:translation initiation factor IF-2
MARSIEIEENITVGTLAEKLSIPVTKLIGQLMKNGIIATVNERVDFDTATIMVEDMGLEDVTLTKALEKDDFVESIVKKKTANIIGPNRPPVVAVMGHVDHGKTSLLDAIRKSSVAKGEAGGITQHISAYQIEHNKRLITFLDTPGHEAFAAIRAHGAELTDIVIIVVAADDGVKPQTVEAIRFATQAGSKMIIAINKIDKDGADVNRVKQQLAEKNILVEGWGGDLTAVEVSAKTEKGISELLDIILLTADLEELKAPIDIPAEGLIIESHLERGRGPVAHALVTEGTLNFNDVVIAGSTYAKIRSLTSPEGNPIKIAGPSTPVVITGFKELPQFGDSFKSVKDEKTARIISNEVNLNNKSGFSQNNLNSSELISIINRSNTLQELPVLIKADVQGSLTSVIDSLRTLETDEVAFKIISTGVGSVNGSDIHTAHTANGIIYGFNIELPSEIRRLASRDKVPVKIYKIIYELIDDAKIMLSELLAPEIVENETGLLEIRGVFTSGKAEIIAGGEVLKGKLTVPSLARVIRDKKVLAEVNITNLKRGPQDTKEVFEGEMCGLNIEVRNKLQVEIGDKISFFTRETIQRKL